MIARTLGAWDKITPDGPFTIANRDKYVKLFEDKHGRIESLIRDEGDM